MRTDLPTGARGRTVPGAYLAAKFVVLGIINVLQVSAFVYLSLLGRAGAGAGARLPDAGGHRAGGDGDHQLHHVRLCVSALARSVAQTTPCW